MTLTNKIIILILLFLVTLAARSQSSDTTLVSVDTANGIKKIIHLSFEGLNHTVEGGKTAKITKRTISKFDANGKLIYRSDVVSTMTGCVRDLTNYNVTSIDKSGSYTTLKQKKKGFTIKSFDKNGKLISKKNEKYIYANWLDADENLFEL